MQKKSFLSFPTVMNFICIHWICNKDWKEKIQAKGKMDSEFNSFSVLMLPLSWFIWHYKKETHWTVLSRFCWMKGWILLLSSNYWKGSRVGLKLGNGWAPEESILSFPWPSEFVTIYIWNEDTRKICYSVTKMLPSTYIFMVQF